MDSQNASLSMTINNEQHNNYTTINSFYNRYYIIITRHCGLISRIVYILAFLCLVVVAVSFSFVRAQAHLGYLGLNSCKTVVRSVSSFVCVCVCMLILLYFMCTNK